MLGLVSRIQTIIVSANMGGLVTLQSIQASSSSVSCCTVFLLLLGFLGWIYDTDTHSTLMQWGTRAIPENLP